MNRSLLRKCVAEAQVLLLFCALAVYAFCWLRVWLVSRFDMPRFRTILEQFREYERFSPVPFEQLFTHAGRIAMTFDEPIVVVCMAVWAIGRGSDCVSGEIGRGTMEMLLAQPVSRRQILCSQAAVTILGAAVLALAAWLGIYTGLCLHAVKTSAPASAWTVPWLGLELPNPLAAAEPESVPLQQIVDAAVFAPAALNLFALGFFLAGLTTLLSACDRYRWRTIGLAAGFYVVEVLIKVLSVATDRLSGLSRLTVFSAYEPQRMVSWAVHQPDQAWNVWLPGAAGRGLAWGPLGYDLILLGLGTAAYIAAGWVFQRRDLPAPL
jgi:ABC-2 type transport system permease protein